jgi:hypothetical protein
MEEVPNGNPPESSHDKTPRKFREKYLKKVPLKNPQGSSPKNTLG